MDYTIRVDVKVHRQETAQFVARMIALVTIFIFVAW